MTEIDPDLELERDARRSYDELAAQADRENLRAWREWEKSDPAAFRKALTAMIDQETNPREKQRLIALRGSKPTRRDGVSKPGEGWTPEATCGPSYPEEAPEEIFADAFLDAKREGLSDKEAAKRAYQISEALWEKNAWTTAARIVHACLQCITRSTTPRLARAAETLVLTIMEKLSDEASQAELARKYHITRAAVNKDVQHIRKHKSFGVITEFFFSSPTKRKARAESATKTHAKEKKLRLNPPENSLAGELRKRLAA